MHKSKHVQQQAEREAKMQKVQLRKNVHCKRKEVKKHRKTDIEILKA